MNLSPSPAPTTPAARLVSLDAYRGLVMLLMMAEVLHLCSVARALPDSDFWQFLCHHQSHVEWIGCSLHDLIQPSFSFIVGVAVPFSLARRLTDNPARSRLVLHAAWRSVLLILLGVFLRSTWTRQTNWTFEDTLSQIGLGYFFLFLLGFRSSRGQWIAFGLLLVGYWLAFLLYPLPAADFDYARVGVSEKWLHDNPLPGLAAHWNKNTNLAWAFDTWFLNLFPRENPFTHNGGGYATLSFIPTLATMILGLIAGTVLRSERTPHAKLRWLALAGLASLAVGTLLGALNLCPVVKRIWTPSWVLFSGGWCLLLLAAFYAIIDVYHQRPWAFPLVVIGMNSIAAYCIAHLFEGFIEKNLKTHLGNAPFQLLGPAYERLLLGATILLAYGLILFWMYRRKIFLRL